ncbi:MAG TPA: metal-dependent hydrolase, partial [Methylophilaceae bacterium]|nr:metal-dependent hydrolase [Methylophilaceae bacterium]
EEIRLAALLYDLAEMLMWCFASEKMNTIHKMQQTDRTLRSRELQKQVLGFVGKDLQKEIVQAFHLPPLLSELMADDVSNHQRVKNVRIAVNLARHSANGWDDAALPDDYKEIAELLRVDVERAMQIVGAPKDGIFRT